MKVLSFKIIALLFLISFLNYRCAIPCEEEDRASYKKEAFLHKTDSLNTKNLD